MRADLVRLFDGVWMESARTRDEEREKENRGKYGMDELGLRPLLNIRASRLGRVYVSLSPSCGLALHPSFTCSCCPLLRPTP